MYHFPYSSLFILCLLCISFYICTARPLVALHDNVPEKEQENIVKKLHGAEGNSVGGETNNRTTERSKASVEEEVNLKNVKIRSDNNKKKKKKEEDIISGMGLARSSDLYKFCRGGLFKASSLKESRSRFVSEVRGGKVKENEDEKGEKYKEVEDYVAPHQTPPIHNGN